MWALLLVSLVSLPPRQPVPGRVDLVEVNHVYDFAGTRVLCQLVFYDCPPGDCHVRAWRLLKEASERPVRDWVRGDWIVTWHENDGMHQVRAAAFRETWTQYDVERAERDRLPQERRKGITSR